MVQCNVVMEIYNTATYILSGDDNGDDQLVRNDDFGGSDDNDN